MDKPFLKTDGLRSGTETKCVTPSGKIADHSVRMTGDTVFGDECPRPNLNQGAGLGVSPAVRDYLGLGIKDPCDWKFVEFREVPPGPWATYGDNNTFVIVRRQRNKQFAAK